MNIGFTNPVGLLLGAVTLAATVTPVYGQEHAALIMPEQRRLEVRDPSQLPQIPLAELPRPPTVSRPDREVPALPMSLDEAIRIALANSEVVRVLAGVRAASSGRTVYDPAISNTTIDQQRARFDPVIEVSNAFNRSEPPVAFSDPLDPTRTRIGGIRTDEYGLNVDVSKQTVTGGLFRFGVDARRSRFGPGEFPLSPETRSSAEFAFTQPLLQGAGVDVNLAPILIARIDTERSFFQLKDSVQELVRGVIDGYWALVFARTDVWARQQQVQQAEWAYDLTRIENKVGRKDAADVAQTRAALANFRANLIAAEASLLQREAALRNILGLPPADNSQLVPVSPPSTARLQFDWDGLLDIAQQQRPDLIELKLIIEADQQLLLQARNQALPALDAVMLYRWNGLEGEMPNGANVASEPGQFTDWTLGVNFSVPLGLRQSRASLRRQELVLTRDWAELQQGLHNVVHELAINLRNLDQFYEQYQAFQETRDAARLNLEAQRAQYREGFTNFLNVLLAISDWGNAVSSEAQTLAQYNTELANIERDTGTILETHGIRFTEERFRAIGPLGRLAGYVCYPAAQRPGPNSDRYPSTDEPAENSFDLEDPIQKPRRPTHPGVERLPPVPSSLPETVEADRVSRHRLFRKSLGTFR